MSLGQWLPSSAEYWLEFIAVIYAYAKQDQVKEIYKGDTNLLQHRNG